jgi:signal transduction histidine kinase
MSVKILTIEQWMRRRLGIVLASMIVGLVVTLTAYLCNSWFELAGRESAALQRVAESTALGIAQNNRTLVEAALTSALKDLKAESLSLCQGDMAVFSYPASRASCVTGKRMWARSLKQSIPGINQFHILVETSFIADKGSILLGCLMAIVVLAIGLTSAISLRRKLRGDILEPLRASVESLEDTNIVEINDLRRRIRETAELKARQHSTQVAMTIASQVSHDIRSPLAALDMVVKSLSDLPEDKRLLIRSSIGRIRDIANDLLDKNRSLSNAPPHSLEVEPVRSPEPAQGVQLISSLLDGLVSEKRLQFRSQIGLEIDLTLDHHSYGIFATVNSTEFKRVISNLVNNAVEALNEIGRVVVSVRRHQNEVLISVCDNGQGIPPEILARLGQRGETHGKAGGSGLGLYHARTTVESWGGRFAVRSTVGQGTEVVLALPAAPAPAWFVERLQVASESTVIVLDDDTSIHQIWKGRFESQGAARTHIELVHLSTPDQLKSWVSAHSDEHARYKLFLIDYELLGFRESGLDLIEQLGLQQCSILVTSRFEEKPIRARCEHLGVRLIPKGMAGFVPFALEELPGAPHAPSQLVQPISSLDAVLIDDDQLVHSIWQLSAASHKKSLKTFFSFDSFVGKAGEIGRDVPIYVDVSLANGQRGEIIAEEIVGMGFRSVYLCTGYESSAFSNLAFLKGVIGKDPPFGS